MPLPKAESGVSLGICLPASKRGSTVLPPSRMVCHRFPGLGAFGRGYVGQGQHVGWAMPRLGGHKRCSLSWLGLLLHLWGCTHAAVLLCPCRVYEYQKIPPLINRIPVKARRTHVGAGGKGSLSPQPGVRSSSSSTAGRTKCKCDGAERKRRLGPRVLAH